MEFLAARGAATVHAAPTKSGPLMAREREIAAAGRAIQFDISRFVHSYTESQTPS